MNENCQERWDVATYCPTLAAVGKQKLAWPARTRTLPLHWLDARHPVAQEDQEVTSGTAAYPNASRIRVWSLKNDQRVRSHQHWRVWYPRVGELVRRGLKRIRQTVSRVCAYRLERSKFERAENMRRTRRSSSAASTSTCSDFKHSPTHPQQQQQQQQSLFKL